MKVLRPGKSMANASRTASLTGVATNGTEAASSSGTAPEGARQSSESEGRGENKTPSTTPTTKANPVGSGTAFGWLNAGPQRRTTTNS
jgi:hypothetical protein